METGKTVVLLNLENLYESLYDALNQVKYFFDKNAFYFELFSRNSNLIQQVSICAFAMI